MVSKLSEGTCENCHQLVRLYGFMRATGHGVLGMRVCKACIDKLT